MLEINIYAIYMITRGSFLAKCRMWHDSSVARVGATGTITILSGIHDG